MWERIKTIGKGNSQVAVYRRRAAERRGYEYGLGTYDPKLRLWLEPISPLYACRKIAEQEARQYLRELRMAN